MQKLKCISICSTLLIIISCSGSSTTYPDPSIIETIIPDTGGGDTDNSPPVTGQPVFLSDIEYGKGASIKGEIPLRLDIYQPSNICDANRPTVLFVHGGGFTGGDKGGEVGRILGEAVNGKGFNFVSINYRLEGDKPILSDIFQAIADEFLNLSVDTNPSIIEAAAAAAEDTVSALKWMETNAADYCMDTSRLAYWGSSAGAYTVLQVGYGLNNLGLDFPQPDVVIDYWGDLPRDSDLEFQEAPFLVLHGDADTTVIYQHALDLTARADSVGVPYAFYTVEGAGHGYGAVGVTTRIINGVTLLNLTINFIEAHLVGGTPVYETVSIAK